MQTLFLRITTAFRLCPQIYQNPSAGDSETATGHDGIGTMPLFGSFEWSFASYIAFMFQSDFERGRTVANSNSD